MARLEQQALKSSIDPLYQQIKTYLWAGRGPPLFVPALRRHTGSRCRTMLKHPSLPALPPFLPRLPQMLRASRRGL